MSADDKIPERMMRVKGMKLNVPSNYDPIKRMVNGMWNGEWKREWTNNSAWILYDLLTNTRLFRLHERVKHLTLDKWQFYRSAATCDEVVNGECRFTTNEQITSHEESRQLAINIASELGFTEIAEALTKETKSEYEVAEMRWRTVEADGQECRQCQQPCLTSPVYECQFLEGPEERVSYFICNPCSETIPGLGKP